MTPSISGFLRKEKTDETKKTLRRLDVRVLRIETAYAWVLPARLRDQKNRKWWKRSEFCRPQRTRTRDSFSPTQPRHQQSPCRINVSPQSFVQAALPTHR